jgi:3'-5' exonuclease/Ankyrin repeats (3 copies)
MQAELVQQPSSGLQERCSASRLRRAAGSQSLERLKDALATGWTSGRDIDALNAPKNPLHHAAWTGCLENVRYLVEEMQCNVNMIATGPYCYGKTALFFAATRCRKEVILYLLRLPFANVCILNNKGQSVRSIASSHFRGESSKVSIISLIEQREMEQIALFSAKNGHPEPSEQDKPHMFLPIDANINHEHDPAAASIPLDLSVCSGWVNYRIMKFNDGFEYGDLDPRFVDSTLRRPIDEAKDVITKHAVNPTTKQSRKGSFLKRNPAGSLQLQHEVDSFVERERPTLLLDAVTTSAAGTTNIALDQVTRRRHRSRIQDSHDMNDVLDCAWVHLESLLPSAFIAWKEACGVAHSGDSSASSCTQSEIASEMSEAIGAFLTFVRINRQCQRQPWLHPAVHRLVSWSKLTQTPAASRSSYVRICTREEKDNPLAEHVCWVKAFLSEVLVVVHQQLEQKDRHRVARVLRKMLKCLEGGATADTTAIPRSLTMREHLSSSNQASTVDTLGSSSRVWAIAYHLAEGLTITSFEKTGHKHLVLPHSPIFVSQLAELDEMRHILDKEPLISMDTEWAGSSAKRGISTSNPCLAIIQISTTSPSGPTWIIDVLNSSEEAYVKECKAFVHSLLWSNNLADQHPNADRGPRGTPGSDDGKARIVIGFSFRHDVIMIANWLGVPLPSHWRFMYLDMQLLSTRKDRQRELMGLADSIQQFTDKTLSKTDQCSDWDKRPLTTAQLEYAALDAAILPVLLAETGRRFACFQE